MVPGREGHLTPPAGQHCLARTEKTRDRASLEWFSVPQVEDWSSGHST